ncbi:MAG: hypothetical protein GX061_03240 [Eubacteriaceae bacterium]|nr:hypothetical protein [Eubacteriaceae bacterium]
MKFIHTADNHLFKSFAASKLPPSVAQAYRKDMLSAFREIIAAAGKADILLISGDLTEMAESSAAGVKRVFDLIGSISDTAVFLSCGNHDYLSENNLYKSLSLPPNLCIFPPKLSSVYMEDINTRIWGFSWEKSRYGKLPFDFAKLNTEEINILCLHGDVSDNSPYMSIPPEALKAAGFDYVALGHVHKPGKIAESIYYAGSACALDFSETGPHGYITGVLTKQKGESGKAGYSFTNTDVPSFLSLEVDISGLESYDEIKQSLMGQIKNPDRDMVRVSFKGFRGEGIDIPSLCEELEEELYCLVCKDETSPDYNLEQLYRENKENIIGLFIKQYEGREDRASKAALYAGLDALLPRGKEGAL